MKLIIGLLATSLLVGCETHIDSDQNSDQETYQAGYQTENQENYQYSDQDKIEDEYENEEIYPDILDIETNALPSPLPRPPTGIYTDNLEGQDAIAPLEIKTDAGSDFYVKLKDVSSQKEVITIYIRGGDTTSLEMPLGSYRITYASGDTWYGSENNDYFLNKEFYKADELFTFSSTDNQISGYTIMLYKVIDGNLQTVQIDKSQF